MQPRKTKEGRRKREKATRSNIVIKNNHIPKDGRQGVRFILKEGVYGEK